MHCLKRRTKPWKRDSISWGECCTVNWHGRSSTTFSQPTNLHPQIPSLESEHLRATRIFLLFAEQTVFSGDPAPLAEAIVPKTIILLRTWWCREGSCSLVSSSVTLLERNTAATTVELDITDVAAITIVRTALSPCLILLSSLPSSCKTPSCCCSSHRNGRRRKKRGGEGGRTRRYGPGHMDGSEDIRPVISSSTLSFPPPQPLPDQCFYSGEISLFLTKKLGKFGKFFLF
jgi:hypothetical protein